MIKLQSVFPAVDVIKVSSLMLEQSCHFPSRQPTTIRQVDVPCFIVELLTTQVIRIALTTTTSLQVNSVPVAMHIHTVPFVEEN